MIVGQFETFVLRIWIQNQPFHEQIERKSRS